MSLPSTYVNTPHMAKSMLVVFLRLKMQLPRPSPTSLPSQTPFPTPPSPRRKPCTRSRSLEPK